MDKLGLNVKMQEKPLTPHTGHDLQSRLVMCMIHSSSTTGCVWSLCPSNCLTRQTCTLNAHRCRVKYTDYLKTLCTGWDSHRARWNVQCYFLQNHAHLAFYHNSGLIINTSFFLTESEKGNVPCLKKLTENDYFSQFRKPCWRRSSRLRSERVLPSLIAKLLPLVC